MLQLPHHFSRHPALGLAAADLLTSTGKALIDAELKRGAEDIKTSGARAD